MKTFTYSTGSNVVTEKLSRAVKNNGSVQDGRPFFHTEHAEAFLKRTAPFPLSFTSAFTALFSTWISMKICVASAYFIALVKASVTFS